MKKLNQEETERYRKYHIPGTGNLNSVKLDALFIRKGNTYKHEKRKFDECWQILKDGGHFLTEAERSKKRGEKDKIVDVVDLTSGYEIEVIHKHEKDIDLFNYRKQGVIPAIVDPMCCGECQEYYPRRSKKNVCQLCKGVQ